MCGIIYSSTYILYCIAHIQNRTVCVSNLTAQIHFSPSVFLSHIEFRLHHDHHHSHRTYLLYAGCMYFITWVCVCVHSLELLLFLEKRKMGCVDLSLLLLPQLQLLITQNPLSNCSTRKMMKVKTLIHHQNIYVHPITHLVLWHTYLLPLARVVMIVQSSIHTFSFVTLCLPNTKV